MKGIINIIVITVGLLAIVTLVEKNQKGRSKDESYVKSDIEDEKIKDNQPIHEKVFIKNDIILCSPDEAQVYNTDCYHLMFQQPNDIETLTLIEKWNNDTIHSTQPYTLLKEYKTGYGIYKDANNLLFKFFIKSMDQYIYTHEIHRKYISEIDSLRNQWQSLTPEQKKIDVSKDCIIEIGKIYYNDIFEYKVLQLTNKGYVHYTLYSKSNGEEIKTELIGIDTKFKNYMSKSEFCKAINL